MGPVSSSSYTFSEKKSKYTWNEPAFLGFKIWNAFNAHKSGHDTFSPWCCNSTRDYLNPISPKTCPKSQRNAKKSVIWTRAPNPPGTRHQGTPRHETPLKYFPSFTSKNTSYMQPKHDLQHFPTAWNAREVNNRDKQGGKGGKPTEFEHESARREKGIGDQWRRTDFSFSNDHPERNASCRCFGGGMGGLCFRIGRLPGVGNTRRTGISRFSVALLFFGWGFCLSPCARIDNGMGLVILWCKNRNTYG